MQFIVAGDNVAARNLVYDTLAADQWRVTPKGDWDAMAEHGSKAGSFWGGSLAGKAGRYVVLNINLSPSSCGNTIVKFVQKSNGFSGGFIGMGQAKSVYADMYGHIEAALTSAGIFISKDKI